MGVNSLPKTVTRQRHNCDLNLGPSAPESSTVTTQLLSHPKEERVHIKKTVINLYPGVHGQTGTEMF